MKTITISCAAALLLPFTAATSAAAVLNPVSVTASTSAGAAPGGSVVYTDDLFLDSLTFLDGLGASVDYRATSDAFAAARSVRVLTNRGKFNAEWGDTDDASDGDGNPLAKAGFPTEEQETGNAGIQDRALIAAVNSRSISELIDGEGGGTGSFGVEFSKTLAYRDVGGDGLPDIVFIERGGNDEFDIELLLGGTLEAPRYSNSVSIDSGDFAPSGFNINTVEIGSAQELFIGGLDFSDFGLASDDVVSGFRLTTSSGPDLGGFFLTARNSDLFGTPGARIVVPAPVPLPAPAFFLLGGLGALAMMRRRSRA